MSTDAKLELSNKTTLYHALPLSHGQTRVLRLRPIPTVSGLEGELLVVNISEEGTTSLPHTEEEIKFTALSYTWGTGPYCDSITLSGCRKDIKENLADFLYQYRTTIPAEDNAYLWIDALCINQNDSVEKSSQVAVMRSFYSAADNVIVWLGRGGRYTAKAVEYFRKVEEEATKGSSALSPEEIEKLHNDGTLYGLVDVYSRLWSTRIWIKQEVWAARYVTVWCGQHSWHPQAWASFGAALYLAGEGDLLSNRLKRLGLDESATTALLGLEWGPPLDRPAGAEGDAHRSSESEAPKRDILDLIIGSAWSQCSDERDRIYALLGMSTLKLSDLTVDYQKSPEEVYTDLAIYVATSRRSIGALFGLNAAFGAQDGLLLPSWVPDWRSLTDGPAKYRFLEQATLVDNDSALDQYSRYRGLTLRGYHITVVRQYESIFTTNDLNAEEGDSVVACFGCGLPLLLRHSLDGVSPLEMHYKFVGLLRDWSCLAVGEKLVPELQKWWTPKIIDAQSFFEEARGQRIFSFYFDPLEAGYKLSFLG